MKNVRNKDSANFLSPAKTRAARIAPGPKPVWGHLEVRLAEWIKEMHVQRMAVTRVLVLHKALEFEPNFMGGLLDIGFINRAMQWYYRFISRCRYNLSIQKPTSTGQKLPDGWQATWRRCVTDMFELRRREDIVAEYNRQ